MRIPRRILVPIANTPRGDPSREPSTEDRCKEGDACEGMNVSSEKREEKGSNEKEREYREKGTTSWGLFLSLSLSCH